MTHDASGHDAASGAPVPPFAAIPSGTRHVMLVVVLSILSMLGAFSIDAYLPAFQDIQNSFSVSREAVQSTLSVYLLTFAFMMLFHGTLSDSFGRRPVILWSVAGYAAGSVAAIFAPSLGSLLAARALQGLSAGAGSVVGRAIIRDLYPGSAGQKMMAHVMMVFSVAPAIAPVMGGWLLANPLGQWAASHAGLPPLLSGLLEKFHGWRAIFVFLALVSISTLAMCLRILPESLPPASRVPFAPRNLLRSYWTVASGRGFLLQATGLGLGFGGFSLYISTAPDFVMGVLHRSETEFAWLFIPIIIGMMSGSALSASWSSRLTPARQIRTGYLIMGGAAVVNFFYLWLFTPAIPWAVIPCMVYMFGLCIASPPMTVQILDLFPASRGLCASLQGFVQMFLFAGMSVLAEHMNVKNALPIKLGTAVLAGWALSILLWKLGNRATTVKSGGHDSGSPASPASGMAT